MLRALGVQSRSRPRPPGVPKRSRSRSPKVAGAGGSARNTTTRSTEAKANKTGKPDTDSSPPGVVHVAHAPTPKAYSAKIADSAEMIDAERAVMATRAAMESNQRTHRAAMESNQRTQRAAMESNERTQRVTTKRAESKPESAKKSAFDEESAAQKIKKGSASNQDPTSQEANVPYHHQAQTSQEVKVPDARAAHQRHVYTHAPTNETATLTHDANATKKRETDGRQKSDAKDAGQIATREKNELSKHEQEDKARREAEDKARREAEDNARREAEDKARREAEDNARREAEESARRENKARREEEERLKREAEESLKREAEEKARREAEENTRREAEEKARREVWETIKTIANGVGYILRNTRRAAYGSSGFMADQYPDNPIQYENRKPFEAVCNWTGFHEPETINIFHVFEAIDRELSDIQKLHTEESDVFKSREIVGVVLYAKKDERHVYAGIAFPRIVHEKHGTEIILNPELASTTKFKAIYVTATERQVAVFLRRCIIPRLLPPPDPKAAKAAKGAAVDPVSGTAVQNPDVQFLHHMFLDDVGDFDGNTIESATNSFRFCLEKANIADVPASILNYSAYAHKGNTKDLVTSTYKGTVHGDKSSIEKHARYFLFDHHTANTAPKSMSVIIQIGYYDPTSKKGHACSVLVSKSESDERAVVAIADTGETALTRPYYTMVDFSQSRNSSMVPRNDAECAVALIAAAEPQVAHRVARFAAAARSPGIVTSQKDLRQARLYIWMACTGRKMVDKQDDLDKESKKIDSGTISVDGNKAMESNIAPAESDAKHGRVAVSSLTLSAYDTHLKDQIVASHTQRGSTCTFSSTLWLLGIAYAMKKAGGVSLFTKATSEEIRMRSSQILLESVNEMDTELKRAAFAYICETPRDTKHDAKYDNLTGLIAIEYARCAWLDTPTLRSQIRARSTTIPIVGVKHPDTRFSMVQETQPKKLLSLADDVSSLPNLARWIKDRGGYPHEQHYSVKAAAHVLGFIAVARRLLASPLLTNQDKPEYSFDDLLTIAKYTSHLITIIQEQSPVYYEDTLIGMLMRVTRLTVGLAIRQNADLVEITQDKPDDETTLLDKTFATTLPWAAKEFMHLQKEAEKAKRLFLHHSNIDFLNKIKSQLSLQSPSVLSMVASAAKEGLLYVTSLAQSALSASSASPASPKIVSSNEFSPQLITAQETSASQYLRWSQNETKEEQKTSYLNSYNQAQTRISDMRSVMLSDQQISALEFVNTRPSLVALNIIVWFAKSAIKEKRNCIKTSSSKEDDAFTTTYVFGMAKGHSVLFAKSINTDRYTGPVYDYCARIAADRARGGSMLEEIERGSTRGVTNDPVAFRINTDFLYDHTQDCTGRPTVGDGTKDDLHITVKYESGQDSASHDIDSLVELADKDSRECTYQTRGVFYALRRILMPLTWAGPAEEAANKAREALVRASTEKPPNEHRRNERASTEKPPNEHRLSMMTALRLYAQSTADDLITDFNDLVKTRPEQEELREFMVLVYTYLTLALLLGKVDGINAVMQGTHGSGAITVPDTQWAIERTTDKQNEKNLEKQGVAYSYSKRVADGRYYLVVGFEGGGTCFAGELHERLRNSGCEFNYWLVQVNSKSILDYKLLIETHGGLVITIDKKTGDVVATMEEEKEEEAQAAADKKEKITEFKVRTDRSLWWWKTHSSVILPVTATNGEKRGKSGLLVIAGNYKSNGKDTGPGYGKLLVTGRLENTYLSSLFEKRKKKPFFVEFDASGLLLAESTDTEDLVCVFVAYAYAGSMIGTRLMPSVVARSVYDDTPVVFPGFDTTVRSTVIRNVAMGASCPLGDYSACALMYGATSDDSIRKRILRSLRCKESDLHAALVDRLRSGAIYDHVYYERSEEGAQKSIEDRAAFSYWVEHGELEHAVVASAVTQKLQASGKVKHLPENKVYSQTDEWMTTFEGSTGRFVSQIQRDKIGIVTSKAFCVVQMIMGFGKSSVIVPMLVARYISDPSIRVVFVTQPPHLVAPASRAVGALIASRPLVENNKAVFAMNNADFRKILKDNFDAVKNLEGLQCKLVVVLSTADMQGLARDYPSLYKSNARAYAAHIADEVDAESDPLRSEVIIERGDRMHHYNPKISSDKDLLGTYRLLACDLAFGKDDDKETQERINKGIEKLDSVRGGYYTTFPKAGTRLKAVFDGIRKRRNLVYKIDFGFLDDTKLTVVPFEYAGVPSKKRLFSDMDVALAVLVETYAQENIREADILRLESFVNETYGTQGPDIMTALRKDDVLRKRFYLMRLAMSEITTCTEELAVSFFDVFGMANTLVGFSGTMGTTLSLPNYQSDDDRYDLNGTIVELIEDQETNAKVKSLISEARVINVTGKESGKERAKEAIEKIARYIEDLDPKPEFICIVDGCGEFGAFDSDVDTLRETWLNLEYFNDAGTRVRVQDERTPKALYYSHRNSRGVDSEMPKGTIGFVLLSVKRKSGLSSAAQAMFRMRELEDKRHTAVFVCMTSEAAGPKNGTELYAKLEQNEKAYIDSADSLQKKQKLHASKSTTLHNYFVSKFMRPVVYEDVADNTATSSAQKQQEAISQSTSVSTSQNTSEKEVERGSATLCFEKTKPSDADEAPALASSDKHTLLNRDMTSEIKAELAGARIGLSPMICDRNFPGNSRETIPSKRAFALRYDTSESDPEIVVLTIVEAWVLYKEDAERKSEYVYYTHNGVKIKDTRTASGQHDPAPGLLLLGRFLCNDSLSLLEEASLLLYLRDEYENKKNVQNILNVLSCLWKSNFLKDTEQIVRRLYSTHGGNTIAPSSIVTELQSKDGLMKMLTGADQEMRPIFKGVVDRFDWGKASRLMFGRSRTKKRERTMRVFV